MVIPHPLDDSITKVNARLKAAQLGLIIERRGNKLALRGTLPPRPDSDRQRPHQQRIPLGLPATKAGLKQIEQEAKVIAARLIERTFDWHSYLPHATGMVLASTDLATQIAAFEAHYRSQAIDHPEKVAASVKTTWDKAYAPYLRKLTQVCDRRPHLSLPKALIATVQETRNHSRSRQICCTALDAFARFLQIDISADLKSLTGSYSGRLTQKRDLPSDDLILEWFEKIPNPAWRCVYGLMAAYGLRNHEVFFCDYSALRHGDANAVIEVLPTTKTGAHDVWPFLPEWVDRFGLRSLELPPIQTDLNRTTLQQIGQRVSVQFRRYGVPFSPYDLRHAWAVRTILIGLPDTVAARMMGHSVHIHTRTYHRWITRRDQHRAVQTALQSLPSPSP
ncbi:MAG: site-specific integrase [Leptolyngbyaceae cyanobacterium T60_A2020_046]|nr:site-specific integrase [Leptolyngbyaceae cyanobacterium T60_A2020_046]